MGMRRFAFFALVVAGIAGMACGPKGASKETLSALEEAKAAYEQAVQRRDQLKAQLEELQAKTDLKDQCASLQAKRDSLRGYLDLLEQGY